MTLTITGVINPGSALTSSPFIGTIGTDTSSSSTSAAVAFSAGQLSALTTSFQGGVVNQTNDLVITLVPAHQIPQNGVIQVQFPSSIRWTRDLSSTHSIPINGPLNCYGLTSNINNGTLSCSGLFGNQIVTISNPFSQIIPPNQNVSFAIKGLFAPPTTEPID